MLTVVPRYAPYAGVPSAGVSLPLDLPPELALAGTLAAAGPALAAEKASQRERGKAEEVEMGEATEGGSEEAAAIGLGQPLSAAEAAAGVDDLYERQLPLQAHAELYSVWQVSVLHF